MKHDLKFLSAVVIAMGLPLVAGADATLTQAQITQIIKDVQTIDPGKSARAAVMKETLQGEQAVRTGIDSRTELLFNDHTITRLGANTHFSFTEGTRNMSLQSGVMLLQVPKGAGGAKIETAAVTAAVTGTTIMVEAGKNYTKLIVLEGECCLWPKNDKNDKAMFKFKHKTCALAGQEIILRNGAKTIPDPVYVNLKVLEGSSLLITGDWHAPLNNGPIQGAANGQGPGTYVPTNLAIIGAGTDVTVIQGQDPPGNPPPGGSTPPPGFTPPGKYGPLGTVPNSSNYTIGGGSTLNTDPKIINTGNTAYGRIYRGSILDGPPVPYLFGAGTTVSFPTLHVDSEFPNYGVAAFKFTNLNIEGAPAIQMSGNGASDVALISEGAVNVNNTNPSTLDFSQLDELDLFAVGGDINIGANITLMGPNKLQLYSFGAGNNINQDGEVDANDKFFATTQGNYTGNGNINTNNIVAILAGGAITENGNVSASNEIDLEAQGTFGGSGFVSAPTLNLQGGGLMTLNENSGDVTTDDVNGVQLDMNALFELSITGNGINLPNGFTGEPQGSEGPVVDLTLASFDNGVTGSGTINLAGNIQVDNLTATADSAITSSANISSNNSADFTSNNGDVTMNGSINASEISLTGNNITTGSLASFDTGGNGSITITSNGESTATLDGYFNTSTLDITGNDIIINSTVEEGEGQNDGLNASNTINIDATGNVTVNGFLNAPNLNIGGVFESAIPTQVTLTSSGQITANNIYINAGIVDVEGSITGYDNDNASNIFFVDTTAGTGPLRDDNGGSMEDFYSINGSGAIDSGQSRSSRAAILFCCRQRLQAVPR